MYHIRLNIVSPQGLENQIIKITETQKKMNKSSENDKKYSSGFPFPNYHTIISKYEFGSIADPLCFYRCNIVAAGENVYESKNILYLDSNICWNKLVHPNYKLELQIWNHNRKIKSIITDPIKLLETKSLSELFPKYIFDTKVFLIPKNNYGILGVEFSRKGELYHLLAIHIDESKADLYDEITEHIKHSSFN